MSKISEALRNARLAANLSQRAVAAQVGITSQFICEIENGRRELSSKNYPRLPDEIRPAVVEVAIRELEERALWLRRLLTVPPKD